MWLLQRIHSPCRPLPCPPGGLKHIGPAALGWQPGREGTRNPARSHRFPATASVDVHPLSRNPALHAIAAAHRKSAQRHRRRHERAEKLRARRHTGGGGERTGQSRHRSSGRSRVWRGQVTRGGLRRTRHPIQPRNRKSTTPSGRGAACDLRSILRFEIIQPVLR